MNRFKILVRSLMVCCTVAAVMGTSGISALAEDEARLDIHLPVIEEDPASPSHLKTTWSCVWFGSYPSSEVVDSNWDAVDDYALRDGDVIVDDSLYAELENALWESDTLELDGIFYYRCKRDEKESEAGKKEQHYNDDKSDAYHYFMITPIRWRILDMQEDKALLLADRMPDCMPFHEADESVTWGESTLRSWLNGYDASENLQGKDFTGNGFLDRAFTSDEREAILLTRCGNLANQDYGTDSGEDTEDHLFILSNAEVFESEAAGRYGFHAGRDYDDPAKRFTSTLYAKYNGAWWSPVKEYAGNSFWFMRTSGYTPQSVTYICDFGYIYSKGTLVTCSDAGVLPAMWIDLEAADVKEAGETVSTDIMHGENEGQSYSPMEEIADPVIIEDASAPGGYRTEWSMVSFGHYPQTEIVMEMPEGMAETGTDGSAEADPELYQRLQKEAGDAAGEAEVVLDDIKYIRQNSRWFRCDPVSWRVLDVEDGSALLLADKCLDSVPYNLEYTDVFWEDCNLREWLNGTDGRNNGDAWEDNYGDRSFLEMAFTEEEQDAIIVSSVENDCNYYFETACGSGTHDQVFILSEEEVFSSDNRS